MLKSLLFLITLFLLGVNGYAADLAIVHGYVRHVVTEKELEGLKLNTIEVQDPVYKKTKHYAAYRVPDILKLAGIYSNSKTVWVFTASDGFQARVEVSQAIENKAHAYIAVKDLDAPGGWEKFQEGKDMISPGPYYLVWQTPADMPKSIEFPWPYEIKELAIFDSDDHKPKMNGERVFEQNCMMCHSLNLKGGTVGPELNVPRNVLEYENRKFLQAFIEDPSSFRAQSKMPTFKGKLSVGEINDVLDYLAWMGKHKIGQAAEAPAAAEQAPVVASGPNIVKTQKTAHGWELLLNDKPFLVHGMSYYPTTIGEDRTNNTRRNWEMVDDDHDGRNDFGYQTKVNSSRKETGDFELMRRMGVNVIRIYHHVSNNPQLVALNGLGSKDFNYPAKAEKKILRELYSKFGIMSAMGDLLGAYTVSTGATWQAGTDYTDPTQRANMLLSVQDMVEEHKNEPYVLMWILGNENDLPFPHTNAVSQPEAYAKLVEEAAVLIKKIDKGHHPVVICSGSEALLKYYAQYAPDVDIFGINMYQATGFHELWKDVAKTWDRPVLLTEFGTSHPMVTNGKMNEKFQLLIHRFSWEDIFAHTEGHAAPGNAIGGFVFEWVDNWWQDGDPAHQNVNPDGSGWNHEYNGICSMWDGPGGSLRRHLRKVYWMYEKLWKKE